MYNFEDAKLATEASRIENNVERDSKEFATPKVTSTNTDSLQAALNDFNNYPSDVELYGDVTDSTADKDAIANNLRVLISPIRNMADIQYNNGSKYKTFAFEGMDKMDDNNLYSFDRKPRHWYTRTRLAW